MIPAGKLVVDASVVVKWYVPEIGSAEASAILARGDPLLAPDLLVAEFGNVLRKKVRRGELDRSEAGEIVAAFLSSSPVTLLGTSAFLRPAFDLATRWQRTVYDALYLAMALAESCALVTADERLGHGLEKTEVAGTVFTLADLWSVPREERIASD